ncbi:hypothetical protein GGF46_001407 [Coemansia sp. RSA 552]|nr:hypothetical protein GGF46_001407 [Coemansia sp. RSA 552]
MALEPDMPTASDDGGECSTCDGQTLRPQKKPAVAGLLPECLAPTHYDLALRPDEALGTVAGRVAIDIKVRAPTDAAVFHAKDIAIEMAELWRADTCVARTSAAQVEYDAAAETARIPLPAMEAGQHVRLVMRFTAQISAGMYGLYRCRYRRRCGSPGVMLVTQFQAKCARMVFPCWDEPAAKAEFTLALTVPAAHTALSNMPVVRTTTADLPADSKTVHFGRSPRMSTYLLAIVVGELDYIEAPSYSGAPTESAHATDDNEPHSPVPVPVRVYAPAADIDKVAFALATATRVLERLVALFRYAYPLPKLDLVAVPELEAGGMENWGLVLFRTVRLFITRETSLWIRQKAVYVIAHELSHQWFGNLVTMRWWDDLWLNEGFATWIGIHVADQMYPEWRRWDHFAIEDRQAALSADALRSSHPIMVDIAGTADIDQVFDSITYYKGCALIRMLSAHLGIAAFMRGVRRYLNAHAYASATTADLWRALEAEGTQVARMMHAWTAHAGYPVITVDDPDADGMVVLRQARYLHSGRPAPEDDRVVWWVPLGLVTSSDEQTLPGVLDTRTGTFEPPADVRWLKLNHDNAGLFRVCYAPEWRRRLAAAIGAGELRAVDAVGVLNDMVALVASGYMRTSALLDMVEPFRCAAAGAEAGYVVWQILGCFLESLHLTWADRSPRDDRVREHIRALARSLFAPQAAALGWAPRAGDSPLVARLRTTAIPRAAWAGDQQTIADACALFAEFYESPGARPFHPDFTAIVFELAVRGGGRENHARAREMYESPGRWGLSEDHRMAALGATACTQEEDLMVDTLEYTLSDRVLPQDLNIVIGFMVSSSTTDGRAKHVLWQWFRRSYPRIVARLGKCSALLGHVVGAVVVEFATEEMAAAIEAWFAENRTAVFERSLPQSLEFIRTRAQWHRRDAADVAAWFGEPVQMNNGAT